MINRRKLITALGSAAAAVWPAAVGAQQIRRIGVLMSIADGLEGRSRIGAFRQGLQQLHWIVGQNLQIEVRWAGGDVEHSRTYATELIGLEPDVLVAHAPLALASLQQKTRSIPIAFLQVPDPVEQGFRRSASYVDRILKGETAPGAGIVGNLADRRSDERTSSDGGSACARHGPGRTFS